MTATRLGGARLGAVLMLATLTVGVGLGGAGRLSYHEAFVAQAAREMLASGDLATPTVGGLPWLEKPPLSIWLAALAGRVVGGVSETAARAPAAAAAVSLAAAVALLAARHFGPDVGLLAGLVQATTTWTVVRGRLAEADMPLACLIAWTLVAFDRLRGADEAPGPGPRRAWRWAFFVGLGLTSLAKGVGFGAVLTLAAVGVVLAWDDDRAALRRLAFAPGWVLAAALSLAWPLLAVARNPAVLRLWALHVTDRLAAHPEHFAGQSGPQYVLGVALALLPWLPLGVLGAWRSLPWALSRHGRGRGERLLLAWAAAPSALLLLATVRNAHYVVHALPPWSVWAALGLTRLVERRRARGWNWTPAQVRAAGAGLFVALGLAFGLGFAWLGPRFDRRGVEWAFYQSAARQLRPGERVALLYHVTEWDRAPYTTPFGPFPHDWAVRLYYLGRPASCRFGLDEVAAWGRAPGASSFAVIGRAVDAPGLARLGRVETLARGPEARSDRAFLLYRVTPTAVAALEEAPVRR